ncbi:arginine/lysine/ornithine decarboxylase [Paenibacillus phyllosphaerae]|uniref:Arginine/lysine/ornithine decarboxylase n=1 Tax=Paenibacillus phyllosphaerae TaxID=274593 RepID=A0A7W5B5N1_9BACL|nr:aminotransferase class I/II-fold pyridoxal phosphate-dependent enzyme [Paenibacillus phyllosphaerae]MBB3114081.1 arginine/lysine/ornithine decarboxylase [Paenibacillus phyllosphaerae]
MKPLQQFHAPIYAMLQQHSKSDPISYHVPGHRFGASLAPLESIEPEAAAAFQAIMKLDVTELSITDDLHDPSGAIAEAQELAAACFGAEQTYFLVGGSTSGNIAMILACCEPDDLILVQRNVHKSIMNGLMLAGARAVFMMPELESENGLQLPPSLFVVEEALILHPNAKAVLLTNPSYFGLSVDLIPYAELIHRHGKMLLVDEAHGAHYGHHPSFPASALAAGADAVVQSTHKTLAALTMGAMLHIQGQRVDRNQLRHALQMTQSSSPSYPLMASLDISRAMIDACGEGLFAPGLEASSRLRSWLDAGHTRFGTRTIMDPNVRMDPLRVLIQDKLGRISGYELQRRLEAHGCWAEMADREVVVLLFGAQTSATDVDRLIKALEQISKVESHDSEGDTRTPDPVRSEFGHINHVGISNVVAFSRVRQATESVTLLEAEGRHCGEAVIPYPPGIPIVYPGELLHKETIETIAQLAKLGARFQGASDGTMNTIQVRK